MNMGSYTLIYNSLGAIESVVCLTKKQKDLLFSFSSERKQFDNSFENILGDLDFSKQCGNFA
jgi:hypothetical protein